MEKYFRLSKDFRYSLLDCNCCKIAIRGDSENAICDQLGTIWCRSCAGVKKDEQLEIYSKPPPSDWEQEECSFCKEPTPGCRCDYELWEADMDRGGE